MKLYKWCAAALLAVFSLSTLAGESGPQKGNVLISPLGLYLEHAKEYGIDDDEIRPAIAVGWAFNDQWMAELLHFDSDRDFRLGGTSDEVDTDALWLNLTYLFPNEGHWQPYVTLGGGRTSYDYPGALSNRDDNQYNLGLGFFKNFSPRVSVRTDVRGVYSNDHDDVNPMATVGLSLALGAITPPTPPDSDGDGVPDDRDKCPNTPPGTRVGSDGCELDSDGDGVPDSKDKCPNTPANVKVDSTGCPLDSDGDGVPDYRDKCPDSERGARVDENGCYVELKETVTMDMRLEFDLDSAELRPDHKPELDKVVKFLREYPTSSAVIEGHTDSTGTDDYNLALSKRRADSVMRYLVSEGGVSSARLKTEGYGEERPIADNSTPQGRQDNRRVSAVISGTRTVRQ